MTSLARLYSSRAVKVSSTSLGSSSTIKIRPSLFVVSISLLVVLEMRNRTSRRDQRRPRPRPCLRDDVLCAEPWPVQCQCLQMHQTGAGVETRQTVYLHTSYQNPPRCPQLNTTNSSLFPSAHPISISACVRVRVNLSALEIRLTRTTL